MKHQSYKIKHDFLFDCDDIPLVIPKLDSAISEANELKLSDILSVKDEYSFMKLVGVSKQNIVIIDDIGECINPSSERYKQFILRCICRKLKNHNINAYL